MASKPDWVEKQKDVSILRVRSVKLTMMSGVCSISESGLGIICQLWRAWEGRVPGYLWWIYSQVSKISLRGIDIDTESCNNSKVLHLCKTEWTGLTLKCSVVVWSEVVADYVFSRQCSFPHLFLTSLLDWLNRKWRPAESTRVTNKVKRIITRFTKVKRIITAQSSLCGRQETGWWQMPGIIRT